MDTGDLLSFLVIISLRLSLSPLRFGKHGSDGCQSGHAGQLVEAEEETKEMLSFLYFF